MIELNLGWIVVIAGFFNFINVFVGADFSSLISKPFFKDNTMMIKYFLEDCNKRILVTAPRSSGRTTNLLMLKSFLEISVDEHGNKRKVNTTSNYRLFDDNNLNIFEHKDFVQTHFGKYPVIFINCRTLGNIFNYKELLMEFRHTLRSIFSQHKYLLLQRNLWSDHQERQNFNKFFMGDRTKKLNANDMIKGVSYLAEILKLHFKKPAILLLDDYDIIAEKLTTDVISDTDEVVNFFKTLYTSLLKPNKFVERALVTGLFNGTNTEFPKTLPDDIASYGYMEKRPFCKYFRHTF